MLSLRKILLILSVFAIMKPSVTQQSKSNIPVWFQNIYDKYRVDYLKESPIFNKVYEQDDGKPMSLRNIVVSPCRDGYAKDRTGKCRKILKKRSSNKPQS